MELTTKKCIQCGEEKPRTAFYPRNNRQRGTASQCKECARAKARNRARSLRERLDVEGKNLSGKTCPRCREYKAIAAFARDRGDLTGYRAYCKPCRAQDRRLERYKMTPAEFEHMKEEQGERCVLCGEKAKLVVDHCHHHEAVRSLLCGNCNSGLGHFKENQEALARAIQYLRAHDMKRLTGSTHVVTFEDL